jgi:hypothetical protein
MKMFLLHCGEEYGNIQPELKEEGRGSGDNKICQITYRYRRRRAAMCFLKPCVEPLIDAAEGGVVRYRY